jgi:endonuclease YncB( thermonuclease family)
MTTIPEKIKHQLQAIKNSEIAEFTLNNVVTYGKIVEIYDGDTCKLVLHVHNGLQKFNCRLMGLDTPEMKPLKSKEHREEEIAKAHQCRNRVIQLATNCPCTLTDIIKKPECQKLMDQNTTLVKVHCHEFDKYGRLLVTIFPLHGDKSVNDLLISEGMAYAYAGGTKKIIDYAK